MRLPQSDRFSRSFLTVVLVAASAWSAELDDRVTAAIGDIAPHPRLLMTASDEVRVREEIAVQETKDALFALIRKNANEILVQPPVVRKQEGKRLLSVSREALRRILCLAFVSRITGEAVYAERAIGEMVAAAAFSDWNPSHFLDVAEMTTALALGYDWLFPLLSPEQEAQIRRAIIEKGLDPSFTGKHGWVSGDNNWNQVCHGGLVLGALALLEREPERAVRVIARALEGLPCAMKEYQPDGVYVEGPSYWAYGTTYNILCIAALESALNMDFGLTEFPGFLETGAFPLYMTGPTGNHFSFSDCGSRSGCFPAMYWFARRLNDPGLLLFEHSWLQKTLLGEASSNDRFLPLVLLWWDGSVPGTPRQPLHWKGEGLNPVAVHRTSWTDPNAVFFAVKGGTPSANHGHMDIGSFILEADGVRWVLDIMGRGYGDLEARGMGIWNKSQDSDRWRIYRYHNRSHNTLTVNDQAQDVSGRASITAFGGEPDDAFTIIDMAPVYEGELAEARRGFFLLPDGRLWIQDELVCGTHAADVRWAMTTRADVTITGPGHAVLTEQGKRLLFELHAPAGAVVESFSTVTGNAWDLDDPEIKQVGFQVKLSKGESETLAVLLTPGSRENSSVGEVLMPPLEQWTDK